MRFMLNWSFTSTLSRSLRLVPGIQPFGFAEADLFFAFGTVPEHRRLARRNRS